jgi:hypothetical protein
MLAKRMACGRFSSSTFFYSQIQGLSLMPHQFPSPAILLTIRYLYWSLSIFELFWYIWIFLLIPTLLVLNFSTSLPISNNLRRQIWPNGLEPACLFR